MGSRARRYYIGKDAVQTEHIVDGAVTEAKLADLIYGTVAVDLPSIGPYATGKQTVTVSGLLTSHYVHAMFAEDPGTSIAIVAARVPTSGSLEVIALNCGPGTVDLGSKVVSYLTIK